MARKPGERFPSDHRRWFRVTEDIADDPKLASEKNEWVWGAYLRTLAALNRTKSRDGVLRVSYPGLGAMMGRSRADVARKRLGHLVNIGLMSAARYADFWLILVPKWPEIQGFPPAEPQRCPEKTPRTTPTPRKRKKEERVSEPSGSHTPLLNLLSRETGTAKEKADWIHRELPLLEEMAARDYPEGGESYTRELRSRVIRHYRQHLKGSGKPGTSEETRLMNETTRRNVAEAQRFKAERERLAREGIT